MEITQRSIRRNIHFFYFSTIAYTLSASFLSEGYIQSYLLKIGLDTMSIGIYGTCSTLAALLGFAVFSTHRPKRNSSYVRGIFLFGLLACTLPLALIGANYVVFSAWLLYAGISVYQLSMSMKTSCEFSAIPMLYPRERYGAITAKCGVIGSALAAALSAASAPLLSNSNVLVTYLAFFALAFLGLLASALAARAYVPMESLTQDEETPKTASQRTLPSRLWILLPHFLRGAAAACFYYFVTISLKSVTLSGVGQSIFVTVGVLSTMAACYVFMKLQDRFKSGPIILCSNIICALSAILTCVNTSEIGFFALYVLYTLSLNVTAYAIPAGTIYSTPVADLPFISSMRLLVMNGATCVLLTPMARLLEFLPAWQMMSIGAAIYIVSGIIFVIQYTDELKKH